MLGIKWNDEIVGQHRHLNHDTSAERKGGIFPECDHKRCKPVKFGVRISNVISHQETQKKHNFLGFRSSFCLFSYLFWNSNHSQLQFASGLCHHFLLVRPYQQNRNNSWDSMVLNASLIPNYSSQMPRWLASCQMSKANFSVRQCVTESKSKFLTMIFGSRESRMPLLKNEWMFASRIQPLCPDSLPVSLHWPVVSGKEQHFVVFCICKSFEQDLF